MQEAHCLLCSKCSLCSSVQWEGRDGVPPRHGVPPGHRVPPGMGYSLHGVPPEMGYPPDLRWGTPTSDLRWGTPPPRPEMGYPPYLRLEMGYPPTSHLRWGNPTPPRKCEQTENITFPHPSDAGGNKSQSSMNTVKAIVSFVSIPHLALQWNGCDGRQMNSSLWVQIHRSWFGRFRKT